MRTSQADPIHGKDVKGNSVLDYLQKVHGLSSEFPRDWLTPYMEKKFILHDLFVVLQDIVTIRENFRVEGILTHNLHSKEWERPVPEDIRRRLIRESKSGENAEYFIRGEMVQLYRERMEQMYRERMEQEHMEQELMSLHLNETITRMPVPSDLHGGMTPPSIDPYRALRDHALLTYAAINND